MFVLESFAALCQLSLHYKNKFKLSKLFYAEIFKPIRFLVIEQGKSTSFVRNFNFLLYTQ